MILGKLGSNPAFAIAEIATNGSPLRLPNLPTECASAPFILSDGGLSHRRNHRKTIFLAKLAAAIPLAKVANNQCVSVYFFAQEEISFSGGNGKFANFAIKPAN